MMNAWSPPAWMKSSGSLVAGAILPEYYAHHANYFVKAIQAYEAEGVHVRLRFAEQRAHLLPVRQLSLGPADSLQRHGHPAEGLLASGLQKPTI